MNPLRICQGQLIEGEGVVHASKVLFELLPYIELGIYGGNATTEGVRSLPQAPSSQPSEARAKCGIDT